MTFSVVIQLFNQQIKVNQKVENVTERRFAWNKCLIIYRTKITDNGFACHNTKNACTAASMYANVMVESNLL